MSPSNDTILTRFRKWAVAALFLTLIALGTFLARTANVQDVFIGTRIYFVDADCYSRMSRAEVVERGKAVMIRHHEFENWPEGTRAHTTAPLDWLIVALKRGLDAALTLADGGGGSVLRMQSLDLAGALISPLLGAATAVFLGWWARRVRPGPEQGSRSPFWMAVPALFAISPVLVHGTALGRPDHQSLLLALLAVALGVEWINAPERTISQRRTLLVLGGISWGLALWVSFYEPLVMLLALVAARGLFHRADFFTRERWAWLATLIGIAGLGLVLEGWRIEVPASEMRGYLANWFGTIGELRSLSPLQPTLYRWVGWGVILAPIPLALLCRSDPRARSILALLIVTAGLTFWQIRWGYFLALVFAMSLPWVMGVVRWRWAAWLAFVVSLFPMAQDWDERLYPDLQAQQQKALRRRELVLLREVADRLRAETTTPFLAPWWLSPPLSYWSGQPGVAGSSHESLGGILASSRFYLATGSPGFSEAASILAERRVRLVVTDEPSRVIGTSQAILGAGQIEGDFLADRLMQEPVARVPFLVPSFTNQFYKVYSVDTARLGR